ncbi:MAG: FHA domain-containing protein [Clostridia bacterium]|nr:FHA domain-containing protein [Clostridia bacterium]
MQKNSAIRWISAVMSIIAAICTIAIIGYYNFSNTSSVAQQPGTTVVESTNSETTIAETTSANTTSAETTAAETTVAETTAAETTVAETTAAETTATEATAAETTSAETTVAEAIDTEPAKADDGKISFNISEMFSLSKNKTLNGNALTAETKTGKATFMIVLHIILAIILLAAGIMLMVMSSKVGKIINLVANAIGIVAVIVVAIIASGFSVEVAAGGQIAAGVYELSLGWQFWVEAGILLVSTVLSVVVLCVRDEYDDFAIEGYDEQLGDQTSYMPQINPTTVLEPNADAKQSAYVFSGSVTCLSGEYANATFDIEPGQALNFGKDPSFSNIIFSATSKYVSRRHCTITFDSQREKYVIVDYSSNGTFIEGGVKLPKNEKVYVQRGAQVFLGNKSVCFILN